MIYMMIIEAIEKTKGRWLMALTGFQKLARLPQKCRPQRRKIQVTASEEKKKDMMRSSKSG